MNVEIVYKTYAGAVTKKRQILSRAYTLNTFLEFYGYQLRS